MARTIFAPNKVVQAILDNAVKNNNWTVTEYTNTCIMDANKPVLDDLKKASERIIEEMKSGKAPDKRAVKDAIAYTIKQLRNHPVESCDDLYWLLKPYVQGLRNLNYEYWARVNQAEDEKLQRLNWILAELDPGFNAGMREIGERAVTVFNHWGELRTYAEIYDLLSLIVHCEDEYYPIDPAQVLLLIKRLDIAAVNSKISITAQEYPLKEPSLKERINAVRYQIYVYTADNGYAYMTGDNGFENMSDEMKNYFHAIEHFNSDNLTDEEYLKKLIETESEGRRLFVADYRRRQSQKND